MPAFYYDETPDRRLTDDPEGDLVWLCRACAQNLGSLVLWAADDSDLVAPCDMCRAYGGDDDDDYDVIGALAFLQLCDMCRAHNEQQEDDDARH